MTDRLNEQSGMDANASKAKDTVELAKVRLEVLTFLSGLVTSFASSTGYFYGSVSDEFGPYATLFIAFIWALVFSMLIDIHLHTSLPPETGGEERPTPNTSAAQENESENNNWFARFIRVAKKAEKGLQHGFLWLIYVLYFMLQTLLYIPLLFLRPLYELLRNKVRENQIRGIAIAWLLTLGTWATGAIMHSQKPTQERIQAYVVSHTDHATLPGVQVEISYARHQLMQQHTDASGLLSVPIDLDDNYRFVYLKLSAAGYQSLEETIDLNEYRSYPITEFRMKTLQPDPDKSIEH